MILTDHAVKRAIAEGFEELGVPRSMMVIQCGVINGDLVIRVRWRAIPQWRPSTNLEPVTEHLLLEGDKAPMERLRPWLARVPAYSLGALRAEIRKRGFAWPSILPVVEPPAMITHEPARYAEYA